jgi:signal peptide peptidase SppA
MPREFHHTPECFQSHLGVWAIIPSFLHESLAAIRSGLWRPRAQGAPALPGVPTPTDVDAEGLMPPLLSYFVTQEGVGILPLHGPSMKARSKYGGYSTVDARRQLRAMAGDERVGAILLHLDSPGGHVAGTKELADDVAAVGQTKPVHAYIEDTGASAAYWVASQAKTVAANAMAMVGSLGTFTVLYDLSKMAEMEGVQVHVVSTGERKGAAAPGTPVTDEDLAEARKLVEGFDAFFRQGVRQGRGLGAKEASSAWTGAVWLAGEAKGLGLVDRVESLDSTVERLTAPLRAKAAKARISATSRGG